MKPLLALTMGDVNGVGPEILAKALARPELWEACRPVIIGSAEILDEARRWAPPFLPTQKMTDIRDAALCVDACPVIDGGMTTPPYRPGVLDAEAGRCAAEWLKLAVRLALDGAVAGLVTCPLNKEGIHRAGYHYAGHTEIIAEMCGSPDYRMCLFAGDMRVVHITSHMSMRDAIEAVETPRIVKSIEIAHDALTRLGLSQRRIAVAALNPHAGEAGAFGSEEKDQIEPAIRHCQGEGIDCSGPHPADTVFLRMRHREFELVVSMYHDQGHTPVKLVAMDEGVNVTLGIPIIRTSVDHGTAYDIAGKGLAREESLIAAIRLAAAFAGTGEKGKREKGEKEGR